MDPLLLLQSDKPMLELEVIGARELFNKKGRAIDAYCKVRLGTTEYKTGVAKRTSDPVWGETFVLDFDADTDQVVFEMWDQETFGADQLLGVAVTSMEEVKKGYMQTVAAGSRPSRGLETFFHLIPPPELIL